MTISNFIENQLENYFSIKERHSTISNEVRAGLVTFLTMSYILLVNSYLMHTVGIEAKDTLIATAIASGTASLIAGFGGNLPVGLAPGAGLSAYLVYGLLLSGSLTRSQAFTSVLISGVLLILCAISGLGKEIVKFIPKHIKFATVVGMGTLIAFIGMTSINLIVANPQTMVTLGDLSDYHIWISLVGLMIMGTLFSYEIKGAVLLGILLISVIVWAIDHSWPTHIFTSNLKFDYPISENIDLDPRHYSIGMVPPILAFIFVSIFDISGVTYGMIKLVNIMYHKDDQNQVIDLSNDVAKVTSDIDKENYKLHDILPDTEYDRANLWSFIAAGSGTILAATFGSPPVIVHLESAAGVNEGGRTGLTAVIVGVLFFSSLLFSPIFQAIPETATAPILIIVGAIMLGESVKINWENRSQAIPAFLTIMIMTFTYSVPNGILFGVFTSLAFYFTTGSFLDAIRGHSYTDLGSRSSSLQSLTQGLVEDEKTFIRTPKLIVSKDNADKVGDETEEYESRENTPRYEDNSHL